MVFDIRDISIYYGQNRALAGTSLKIYRNQVTAVIGPSGCGKSTFIRSLNRMNDTIPGFRIEGQVLYHGHDCTGASANRVEVRRRIGMVFQKPNPFPKSIYDNVAWAPRNLGMKRRLDARVEQALRQAALWEEVKDRLQGQRARPLRRSAAAAVHRPRDRDRARRAAAGRAGLGARSGGDGLDRGPDAQPQAPVHDRDRHPQHAASGAGRGPNGVLQPRHDRSGPGRNADRVRRHRDDLPRRRRSAHARLRRGQFG